MPNLQFFDQDPEDDFASQYLGILGERKRGELIRMTQEPKPESTGFANSWLMRPFSGFARGGLGTVAATLHAVKFAETFMGIDLVGDEAQDLAKQFERGIAAITPDDPNFADRLFEGVGSMATFLIPGLGVAGGVSRVARVAPWLARVLGAQTSTVIEGLVESGEAYSQFVNEGKTEQEAASLAASVFVQNYALLSLTNQVGIFGKSNRLATRAAKAALLEGLQEGGQYTIQQRTGEKDFNLGQFLEASAIGAILGGGFATLTHDAIKRIETPNAPIPSRELAEMMGQLGSTAKERAMGTDPEGGPFTQLGMGIDPTTPPGSGQEGAGEGADQPARPAPPEDLGPHTEHDLRAEDPRYTPPRPTTTLLGPEMSTDPAAAERTLRDGTGSTPREIVRNFHAVLQHYEGQDIRRSADFDPDVVRAALDNRNLTDQEAGAIFRAWESFDVGLKAAAEKFTANPSPDTARPMRSALESLVPIVEGSLPDRKGALPRRHALATMSFPQPRAEAAGEALSKTRDDVLAVAIKTMSPPRLMAAATQMNTVLSDPNVKFATTGWFDALVEAWTHGLLTNPGTHVVNITSNALFEIMLVLEAAGGEAVGRFRRGVLGGEGGVAPGTTAAMIQGIVGNIPGAIRAAGKVWRAGRLADEGKRELTEQPRRRRHEMLKLSAGEKFAAALPEGMRNTTLAKGLDYYFSWAFRSLAAGDKLAKHTLEHGVLRAEAVQKAWDDTKGIADPSARTSEMGRIVEGLIANPTPEMWKRAKTLGMYGTFQDEIDKNTAAGGIAESVRQARLKNPVLRIVLPFFNTPVQVFTRTIERAVPGGFAWNAGKAYKAGKMLDADRYAGQFAASAMTLVGLVLLVKSEIITGPGPDDPELRKQMESAGWQPFSIDTGRVMGRQGPPRPGDYLSYRRIEPLGTILGAVATLVTASDYMTDKQYENAAVESSLLAAKLFASSTWMAQVAEFLNLVTDPNVRDAKWEVVGLGGTVVSAVFPKALTNIWKDNDRKQFDGFVESLMANIPGYRGQVADDLDLFGNKRFMGGGFGREAIDNPAWTGAFDKYSPFHTSMANKDQIDLFQVFKQGHIRAPAMGKTMTVFGVEVDLTPHERNHLIRLAAGHDVDVNGRTVEGVRVRGMTLEESLRELVDTDIFKEAFPGGAKWSDPNEPGEHFQRAMVRTLVRRFYKAARERYTMDNPLMRDRANDAVLHQRELSQRFNINIQ